MQPNKSSIKKEEKKKHLSALICFLAASDSDPPNFSALAFSLCKIKSVTINEKEILLSDIVNIHHEAAFKKPFTLHKRK